MTPIHIPIEWSETVWDYMEKHGRLGEDFLTKFAQVNAEVVGFYAIAHTIATAEELRKLEAI